MARMPDGVSGSAASGSESESSVKAGNPLPYRVGFDQVTASLGAGHQVASLELQGNRSGFRVKPIDEEERIVVTVSTPRRLHRVVLGPSEKARTARPAGSVIPIDEDKGQLCSDCGGHPSPLLDL